MPQCCLILKAASANRPAASGPTAIDATDATGYAIGYGEHADQCIDLWNGGRHAERRSLIVLLHGGFWRPVYDRGHMTPMARALARAGWSAANVEYRRVPGEPQVMLDDVSAAVAALVSQPVSAPNNGRLLVAGFSAGGHLALWLAATATQRELIGALGLAPVADLRRAAQLNLGNGAVELLLGSQRARMAELDPAQLPSPARAVAIVHGQHDDTVPVAVSESYVSVHPATSLRIVPGAGHFDLIDPHSAAWPAVVAALSTLAG